MSDKQLKKRIENKKEISLRIVNGEGAVLFRNLIFQGYVYGDDAMQFEFVWGYWPEKKIFYKILLQNVEDATITATIYTSLPQAMFRYSIANAHFATLDGFDNIMSYGSIPNQDEDRLF